jgi:excisionase family DNA binding protein
MESCEHSSDLENGCVSKTREDVIKNLEQNRLYSLQEVSVLLHVSLPTVRRAIKAGTIHFIFIGRLIRVPASEVHRLSMVEHMLTVQEAADLLHVGVYMVRMLIREGTIKAIRLKDKGPSRIPVSEVEKIIKK